MSNPAKASCISSWYRSTMARGVVPSFRRAQGDGRPMLIRTADPDDILLAQTQVPHIHIRREVGTGDVTNVDRAVGIGQRRSDQSPGRSRAHPGEGSHHTRGPERSLRIAILPINPSPLKHILLPVLLILTPIAAGPDSGNGRDREQRLDSLKHIDNPRWWYPGEPITWIRMASWTLFAMKTSTGSYVFAPNPRGRRTTKGRGLLSVLLKARKPCSSKGTCRYISYMTGA